MPWKILTYHLPKDPSRHRVAVWRELRRLGAVTLRQGRWALPSGEGFDDGLTKVVAIIEEGQGEPVVLQLAEDDPGIAWLEALFTKQREAEWVEFLADCDKYEAELLDEVAKAKLTLAELDEEEQSMERLRRWYRVIRARDLFGAPSAPEAQRRLKECADSLDRFATQVYEARGRP
jgi:hypothetical protein